MIAKKTTVLPRGVHGRGVSGDMELSGCIYGRTIDARKTSWAHTRSQAKYSDPHFWHTAVCADILLVILKIRIRFFTASETS